jgi:hypothetical protein
VVVVVVLVAVVVVCCCRCCSHHCMHFIGIMEAQLFFANSPLLCRDVVVRAFSRHGVGRAAAPSAPALGMPVAGHAHSAAGDAAVVGHVWPGLCRACA